MPGGATNELSCSDFEYIDLTILTAKYYVFSGRLYSETLQLPWKLNLSIRWEALQIPETDWDVGSAGYKISIVLALPHIQQLSVLGLVEVHLLICLEIVSMHALVL